jgi:agmatinase
MTNAWYLPPRNFLGLEDGLAGRAAAQVLVLPVPYDSTVSYKSGSREGPQAIIDASTQVETFDIELCKEICAAGIHTLPEVAPVMAGPQQMVERLYQVARSLLGEGKLLATLGGEHSLSSALVKAHLERYPNLSVLQFDAHGDLRDSYEDTPYSHACVARRIVEMCPLTQVGIRSMSAEEWEFLQTRPPVTTFFAQPGPLSDAQLDQLVASLHPEVYITLDLDALDPAIIAGVGTPEPGGLGWYETLRILRYVAQRRRIVGFDLMEYCPAEGGTAGAFTSAKLAYKLMGYCLQAWE